MAKKALVIDNVAVNVEPDQATVDANFHPDIAAQFVDVPSTVQTQWRNVGGTWEAPPEPAGSPPAPTTNVIDIPTFMMRFTPSERVAIRASTDALVKDFMSLLDDPRTTRVNLALETVQGAVAYLAGEVGSPPLASPLVDPSRVAAILAPEPL